MKNQKVLYFYSSNECRFKFHQLYHVKYVHEIYLSRYHPQNSLKLALQTLNGTLRKVKYSKVFKYTPKTLSNIGAERFTTTFDHILYQKFNQCLTQLKGQLTLRFISYFKNIASLDVTWRMHEASLPVSQRRLQLLEINLEFEELLSSKLNI